MLPPKTVGASVGWQRQESTPLFESRWYDLRQDHVSLPAGKEITYTYVEHPGAALVVPVTPAGKITLIHLYRYPIDGWIWGVPAGGLGDKPGKSVEEVAHEELLEEAGCVVDRLEGLGEYYLAAGVARLKLHIFLGHGARRAVTPTHEDTEVIDRVEDFPVEEVLEMIYQHRDVEAESAFGILLAVNRLWDWRPRKPR